MHVKFTSHMGAQYRINENEQGFPENVINITLLYKSQVKWDQAEIGASFIKRIPHKRRTMKDWKKTQPKFEPTYKQVKGHKSDDKMPMPLVYAEVGLTYRGIPLFKKYRSGYKNHEAALILFAVNYYDIKVAYTFDFTLSSMQYKNSGGAHEMSLSYTFEVPVSDKKISRQKARKNRALFN